MVEVTSREQLRFDATLAYYMTSEHSSDAALLLYEVSCGGDIASRGLIRPFGSTNIPSVGIVFI